MKIKLIDYIRNKAKFHHSAKLTDDDVREIRRLRAAHPELPYSHIGFMFGVSSTTISHIVNRRTWRHIE